jgi:SAM-dependent methyltransferase
MGIEIYTSSLCAEHLERCYKVAPDRIRRYLATEIDFVRSYIAPFTAVLEIGCGYGRFMKGIWTGINNIVGIDLSFKSLLYGKGFLQQANRTSLLQMHALKLGFRSQSFDSVLCIQNGICAFNLDPIALLEEAQRVAKKSGRVLISTYSDRIWDARLEWFRIQSCVGLLSPIDENRTTPGVIVTQDGFQIKTLTKLDLVKLARRVSPYYDIYEVDDAVIFLVICTHQP